MHYEGVPVSSFYVIAEFASLQKNFGATGYCAKIWQVFVDWHITLSKTWCLNFVLIKTHKTPMQDWVDF